MSAEHTSLSAHTAIVRKQVHNLLLLKQITHTYTIFHKYQTKIKLQVKMIRMMYTKFKRLKKKQAQTDRFTCEHTLKGQFPHWPLNVWALAQSYQSNILNLLVSNLRVLVQVESGVPNRQYISTYQSYTMREFHKLSSAFKH